MRRRMLAWRPTWNPEEVWVEQVRWIDQTEPETEPESALGEAADPPAEADKPVLLERILDLCHLPGDILAVVLTAVTVFVGYGISGIAALVATPFVLAARVVGSLRGAWTCDSTGSWWTSAMRRTAGRLDV